MAHPLALPKTFSPDTLDTTAELAAILSRLQPPTSGGATSAGTPLPGGAKAPTTSAEAAAAATDGSALALRDLPTATDRIKHKLQHARAQIHTLPDVGRTVAEQTVEIAALETRREQQRQVLAALRAQGAALAADEQQQHHHHHQKEEADRMEM